jgi:uncharacterized protein with NRDE domain
MCIVFFEHRPGTETPLILGANREEQFSRPMQDHGVFKINGMKAWVAGRDHGPTGDFERSGTWLGVNENQVVVAVTNRDDGKLHGPDQLRSRGLLCWDLLAAGSAEAAAKIASRELRENPVYGGCNFITVDANHAYVVPFIGCGDQYYDPDSKYWMHSDGDIHKLKAGFHCCCNMWHDDNDDERVQTTLQLAPGFDQYKDYCKQLDLADGSFGTRCSTTIRLGNLLVEHRVGGEFVVVPLW